MTSGTYIRTCGGIELMYICTCVCMFSQLCNWHFVMYVCTHANTHVNTHAYMCVLFMCIRTYMLNNVHVHILLERLYFAYCL